MRTPFDLPLPAVTQVPDRSLLQDAAGRPVGPGGRVLTPEQATVVLERGGPLMVAANAGSGKTTVLVERFVRYVLDDDIDPRAILAITFTRRAAGELRRRIRGRFTELGCGDHARAMEGAWISTIDGFCLRVLSAHAVVAGLDPQLAVLEPGELRPLREEAWETALGAVIGAPGVQPPPGALDLLDRFGYKNLRTLVGDLYDELRSSGQSVPALPRPVAPTLDDTAHLPALEALDALLDAFGTAFTAAKRARHGLDYADLAVATRDLFRGRREIARGYAQRLQRVMVDEFQDTNRLQVELLEELGQEHRFLVGDRLQAIYGFRHAEVAGFEREWAAHAARGQARSLAVNFRSDPPILRLINSALGPAQESFAALEPGRDEPDGADPAVEVLMTDADAWSAVPAADPLVEALGEGMPAGTPVAVQAEARLVAQRARELLDAGWRAGDVVVLLRAGTHMAAYERALELAGVPAVATQGRGWWSRREVQDLLNHLRVLLNPLDEPALLGALAAPFAGLGSDDLARIALERREREHTTLWDAVQLAAGGDDGGLLAGISADTRARLGGYCALVERERRAGAWDGPAALLERLVADTRYDEHVLQGPGGLRRLANIRKLLRLADAFQARSGPDLRAFADHAAAELGAQTPTPDAPLEVGADEAVRLMTIHGAKGLEFPAVIVADLGRYGAGSTPPVLVGEGRVGLRLPRPDGDVDVAFDYADLDAERLAAEQLEERRVMHVAVTRAERLLVLSGTFAGAGWGQPGYRRPALTWMGPGLFGEGAQFPPAPGHLECGDAAARVMVSVPGGELVLPPAPGTQLCAPAEPGPSPVQDEQATGAAGPGARPRPPATLSYSSLAEHERCGYAWYLRRTLRLPDRPAGELADPGLAGEAARLRGTIVHSVLEHADLAPGAPPPDADAVRALARGLGAAPDDEQIDDQLRLARAFLEGPWRERVANAVAVRREAPFACPLRDAPDAPLLTGFIDLLADEPGGAALVIDHKTDRVAPDADLEALVARDYAVQRAVYALAVLSAGAERVEVVHLYLERGEAATATFGGADVPALRELVGAAAAPLLDGVFQPAAEPHAGICATCPGRGGLCPQPPQLTDRPRP